MPKKLFVDKEKTLAEEGLFPRAMLQVKEDDEWIYTRQRDIINN